MARRSWDRCESSGVRLRACLRLQTLDLSGQLLHPGGPVFEASLQPPIGREKAIALEAQACHFVERFVIVHRIRGGRLRRPAATLPRIAPTTARPARCN